MLRNFLAATTSVCLLISCDYAIDLASRHLHSLGYKDVVCEQVARGAAHCVADSTHFWCTSTRSDGCALNNMTTCERFYLEKPAL